MPTSPTRLYYLLQRYAADSCTRKELAELLQAIDDAKNDQDLGSSLQAIWQDLTGSDAAPHVDRERVFSNIISDPAFGVSGTRRLWFRRIAAAAVFLLLAGAAAYFISLNPSRKTASSPTRVIADARPGGNKAILTLADGSTIVLDSSHNGELGQQGNTRLIKLDSGQLAYRVLSAGGPVASLQYNTIATPRGGQYQVVLPDGTKVWLNASSALRFPTAFDKGRREVDLSGEAYFEVAKEKIPFTVHIYSSPVGMGGAGGQRPVSGIDVLGTHFNVNAYGDEMAVTATLLEGSIRMTAKEGQQMLRPGEQCMYLKAGGIPRVVPDADVEAAIAWKNGYFQFDGVGTEVLMRQLSRWYDVDVEYEGPVTERQFGGQMPRSSNLSEVLRILEASNVHFRIEGKKLVVTP
ncbi:MAG TPA: FecR domain-containing protein [Puia sp.]|nr:FecR domain-containing protein [Puia sp.]